VHRKPHPHHPLGDGGFFLLLPEPAGSIGAVACQGKPGCHGATFMKNCARSRSLNKPVSEHSAKAPNRSNQSSEF